MKAVSLEGERELSKKFKHLIEFVDDKDMVTALLKPAIRLRNRIRQAAPKGATGNLKRGIRAKRFRKKIPGAPAVFVAPNYKIAPHAWLVDRGTQGIRPAGKKRLLGRKEGRYVNIGGNVVFITHTGRMPASYFFTNTVDKEERKTIKQMEHYVWKAIEKKANK